MSIRDKWVRRFSIDETSRHKNGFTVYKITSVLFPLESPEAVTVVSVWKRYSDIQQLHKSMKSLHAGLHLRGTFPTLAKSSFFKRFQQEVIEERAKSIKELLEFIAEHRLLFTSTDFVNFLQDGYPEPEQESGVINAIRSSLQLPVEHTPPLEYQSDDESSHNAQNPQEAPSESATDFDISQIPIYEATEVEIRDSPKDCTRSGTSDSFESINSLESLDSDFYDELKQIPVKPISTIKRNLPDLIDFERPSTSVSRDVTDCARSVTSVASVNESGGAKDVEGGYAVEAGYLLSVAGRCEDAGDFERAFEFYKTGIEKLLLGVQSEADESRRSLLKQKANKYLSHAERVYNEQLSNRPNELPPLADTGAIPSSLLARGVEALAEYRVLGVLADRHMLVTDSQHKCYAMKVIPKVPRNLTELDTYLGTGLDTYTPILPTVVPYMVPLQAHITTEDRIFLVLTYAPGERLTDYIRNYVRSHPNTPKKDLSNSPKKDSGYPYSPKKGALGGGEYPHSPNKDGPACAQYIDSPKLEAVNIQYLSSPNKGTPESTQYLHSPKKDAANKNSPKKNTSDVPIISDEQNNIHLSKESLMDSKVSTGMDSNKNITIPDDVSEIVLNSQRLLMNVDKALNQARVVEENIEDVPKSVGAAESVEKKAEDTSETFDDVQVRPCWVLDAALRRWAAQVLTALSALHAAGARCGDLHARNVLLLRGAAVLTYTPGWTHARVLGGGGGGGGPRACVAPELRGPAGCDARVADYWSYGAVLYELFLGEPLRACDVWWGRAGAPLPAGLHPHMHDLLERLLAPDPDERLGASGPDEIRAHPYFSGVDWQALADAWLAPE